MFRDSLEVAILIKSGRLQEAVKEFRVNFGTQFESKKHRTVLFSIVESLIIAVKDSKDEELIKEVMQLVAQMDRSNVAVKTQSLEDELLKEIVPRTLSSSTRELENYAEVDESCQT